MSEPTTISSFHMSRLAWAAGGSIFGKEGNWLGRVDWLRTVVRPPKVAPAAGGRRTTRISRALGGCCDRDGHRAQVSVPVQCASACLTSITISKVSQ